MRHFYGSTNTSELNPLIVSTPWLGVSNAWLEWGDAKLWGRRMIGKMLSSSLLLVLFGGCGALPQAPGRRGAWVHGYGVIDAMPPSQDACYYKVQTVWACS
jgi:hypothetical protein